MRNVLSGEQKHLIGLFCSLANLTLHLKPAESNPAVQALVNQVQELFGWSPRQGEELLWELGLLTKKRRRIGYKRLCSYVASLQNFRCIPTKLRPASLQ